LISAKISVPPAGERVLTMNKLQTRRQFIRNLGYGAAGVALLGCGNDDSDATTDGGATPSEAPVWRSIPAQTWIVGVPVYIDLNDYVTDPDDDALTFSLDEALPDGVTLDGSVISGTPTAVTATASYMVSADDGSG
jgi:hypothetical protein